MAGDDKFIMRSGGFAAVFFGGLILLCLYCLDIGLHDGPGSSSPAGYYLGLVILTGFPAYLLYFLLIQKVELTRDRLLARYVFRSRRPVQWTIHLSDISDVMLATIGQIKHSHSELARTRNLHRLIDQYESLNARGFSPGMAVQFTPLIIIRTKNIDNTRAIITKPFSRRGCRALMAAFRQREIKATGDEKL